MKKICFISSSGGHFEQLMMLKPIMDKYESFIVTERTDYLAFEGEARIYYLEQVNRNEKTFIYRMIKNTLRTITIFFKEKPDIVISTGVLSTIPMCLLSKLFRKRLVYLESFANINEPTLTGKFLYKFADRFYVQWEEMLKVYPNAIYKGVVH